MKGKGEIFHEFCEKVPVFGVHIFKIHIIPVKAVYFREGSHAGNEFFLFLPVMHEKGCGFDVEIIVNEGHHLHICLPGPFEVVKVPAVSIFFHVLIASHGGRKDRGSGKG